MNIVALISLRDSCNGNFICYKLSQGKKKQKKTGKPSLSWKPRIWHISFPREMFMNELYVSSGLVTMQASLIPL